MMDRLLRDLLRMAYFRKKNSQKKPQVPNLTEKPDIASPVILEIIRNDPCLKGYENSLSL
jgi:hypothetical protein